MNAAGEGSSPDPTARPSTPHRMPLWMLTVGICAVIAAVLGGLAVLGGGALPERTGPPVEELAVERAVLSAGTIELSMRNIGPDPVQVAQVFVNDTYVDFTGGARPVGRLGSTTVTLHYPWQDGQPYTVSLLTSTGVVIEHSIPAAVATPQPGAGLIGVMILLGTYVGVIPVALGMLVLPLLRRVGRQVVRILLAVTVGLLAFLAVDAALEGLALATASGGAFGGQALVLLAAGLAYLALTVIDRALDRRARTGPAGGLRLSVMIAIGIGLHNLGEGLAIGSAYAVGELALGTALVVGFALHNTTEGLAVVAPLASTRPSLITLTGLGLLAGAPAILGAVLGATVSSTEASAALLGVGVGAILQVIVQIAPGLRDSGTSRLEPGVIGGIVVGAAVMYLTGLLVAA